MFSKFATNIAQKLNIILQWYPILFLVTTKIKL